MEKMVQKSVRIPIKLVEFVSDQPGADFSKKLIAILTEYKDGELERKLMIQRYDEQIAERKQRLDALIKDINCVTRIQNRVLDLVSEVDRAEFAQAELSLK